jgi:hypothetical protein
MGWRENSHPIPLTDRGNNRHNCLIKKEIMKTFKYTTAVLLISILTQSCHKGGPWGIRGEGSTYTETRSASGFNGIKLSVDADLSYAADSVYFVEISAQKNILAVIETKVSGTDLCFDFRRNVMKYERISIVVHSPSLNKLQVSGSGNATIQSTLNTSNLELNVSGSGNISVPTISVQSLTSNISGSGYMKISGGNAPSAHFSISGSGSVASEFLNTKNSDVTISGSGNITLTVSDRLTGNISGSGIVKYHGTPKTDVHVSGSGSVLSLD